MKNSEENQGPWPSNNGRFNTDFVKNESENDDLPESLKKNQGKYKLANYRRLSHDVFFTKRKSSCD